MINKLIETLQQWQEEAEGKPVGLKEPAAYQRVIDEIKRLENDNWIPCSKKLPEPRKDVLVDFGDEYPVIAWYSEINNLWRNSSTDIRIDAEQIKAWQPLPGPYKEESKC